MIAAIGRATPTTSRPAVNNEPLPAGPVDAVGFAGKKICEFSYFSCARLAGWSWRFVPAQAAFAD